MSDLFHTIAEALRSEKEENENVLIAKFMGLQVYENCRKCGPFLLRN